MPHTKSVKMIAACVITAIGSSSGHSQLPSTEIAIPTIVISVQKMAAATSNSSATFALYNGEGLVSLTNANGDIVVHNPTDIRFVFTSDAVTQYAPIGITFRQTSGALVGEASTGSSDPFGTRNFSARSVANTVLTVHANASDLAGFEYSILFERRKDGAVGIIDPQVLCTPDEDY